MIPDWNTVFRQSEQIKSVDEATGLLNSICAMVGVQHFQIEESNVVLAASVDRDGPAPLRADAAIIFDQLNNHNSPLATNRPFWLNDPEFLSNVARGTSQLLCCPVRYGKSEETRALFLTHSEPVSELEAALLQSCLIRILERLLKLGLLLKQKNQPLRKREQLCLSMYAQGRSVAQISRELELTEQVVVQMMSTARSRLLANNLSHAIAIAIRNEII